MLRTSAVRGFVDLHCHWVAAVDDGARTVDESLAMLRGLHQAGFDTIVATPHMRPGMFDNDRASIERAFAAMKPALSAEGALPSIHLGSEHFFDDVVYGRHEFTEQWAHEASIVPMELWPMLRYRRETHRVRP